MWNKITDKIPERVNTQIYSENYLVSDGKSIRMAYYHFINNEFNVISDGIRLLRITHWQPLPELPNN